MSLSAGTKLGPYEIVGPVGAGGMGEVYRAHDARLQRDVAVKVLPAAFSTDHERLTRFEQEARAVASISHPNIMAVYDIGRYQPEAVGPWVPYIVSELLEGETLRARLGNHEVGDPPEAARGLPMRKAIEYAVQIAHGLAAAHEKHIAHRDLKPENIFITRDDRVKILDFGLAKLTERTPMTASEASRSAASPETIPGIVMGTVGYMAPEQVRGQDVDHHADIFSLGAVLYEMVSGRRAFPGHFSEAMNAIIKEHPADLSSFLGNLPPALDRIVSRCLEKSAPARFHSAGDLAFALNALSGDSGESRPLVSGVAALRRGSAFAVTTVIIGGLALVALLTLMTNYVRQATIEKTPAAIETRTPALPAPGPVAAAGPPAAPIITQTLRFAITPPAGSVSTGGLSVSPDGRLVAFSARSTDGADSQSLLWIRSLDALTARSLPGTERAVGPFWSPDAKFLGFFADGKLKRIDISGGTSTTLCDVGSAARTAAWSADGIIVFLGAIGGSSGLFRVAASGGVPALVTKVAQLPPAWSPVTFLPGRQVLFSVPSGRGVRASVASLDSGRQTAISRLTASGPVVYSQGHLIFARDTTVMAQSFDVDQLSLTGEPFSLADAGEQARLRSSAAMSAHLGVFATSENGVLAYLTEFSGGSPQLTWFDRAGHQVTPIGERGDYGYVRLSPDEKRAAVSMPDPTVGSRDLWILDLTRGVRTRLTFDAADDDSAVWSPDGGRIVFSSRRKGRRDLFQRASDGTGNDTEFFADDHNNTPLSWTPNGRFILLSSDEGGGRLWVLPLAGGKKPTPLHQTTFRETEGQFSPDGDWIAYVSNESGRDEVYVAPFPGPGPKFQISMVGGSQPLWRRDGKEIFYVAPANKLMAVAINLRGSRVEASTAQPLLDVSPVGGGMAYAASGDGQRFLVNTADAPPASTIAIVVNWLTSRNK
jgi:Tol biopolymer transport system component